MLSKKPLTYFLHSSNISLIPSTGSKKEGGEGRNEGGRGSGGTGGVGEEES